uniref:Putative secreted salivary protein n=1 Tax=Ixodes scapularis TaxID=6945 RepID=Q4PN45_IXOSC|nr:putative secreted salivary protein [Ixodes scapularis]
MGFFLWGWVSAAASVVLSWRPVRCSCGPTEFGFKASPRFQAQHESGSSEAACSDGSSCLYSIWLH